MEIGKDNDSKPPSYNCTTHPSVQSSGCIKVTLEASTIHGSIIKVGQIGSNGLVNLMSGAHKLSKKIRILFFVLTKYI